MVAIVVLTKGITVTKIAHFSCEHEVCAEIKTIFSAWFLINVY